MDWDALTRLESEDGQGAPSVLFGALDENASWLRPVAFGEQIDRYYFESWTGRLEFNQWFQERRADMDDGVVGQRVSLFMEVGLLHDDETAAPSPMKKELTFATEWLIGAIPPGDVKVLLARAESLDLTGLQPEFETRSKRRPVTTCQTAKSSCCGCRS